MPDNIKESLDIQPVRWIDQLLEFALEKTPTPLSADELSEAERDAEQFAALDARDEVEEGEKSPRRRH